MTKDEKRIGSEGLLWPKVCAVTAIHNRIEETQRFLESLQKVDYPNLDSIVIDDGSTDGSSDMIAVKFPETTVLRGDGSLWWSGATNLGVRLALTRGASFVLTLNNDVVLDPNCIKASVRCALAHVGSLVGSKICRLDEPKAVWFTGAYFDTESGDIRLVTDSKDISEVREVDMLTGMGMLIPTDAFRRIGSFDEESFPQYFADSDFSLRAKSVGFKLLLAADSLIYNDVSSSWSAKEFEKGDLRFIARLLVSRRSPYSLTARYRLYRRHWGKGFRRALIRLYVNGWWKNHARLLLRRKRILLVRKLRGVK